MTAASPNPGWRRGFSAGVLVAIVAALALSAPDDAAAKSCAKQNTIPGSVSADKAEHAVLCLLNKQRVKRDVPKLDRHRDLDRPALDHSRLMVRKKCFEHVCAGEPDLGDRLEDYLGNAGGGWGENIAYGTADAGTPRSIVRSWMNSEGHRRNILNPNFEHIGIGIVWGSPKPGVEGDAGTFTTDFGYRGG